MSDDLPEPLDVIAVGAHPDDVEIAVGGTLARLVQQGYRVGIIDLTDGEPTPLSPGPEVRAAEAEEAGRVLGVHVRENLNLPNRKLFDTYEHRVALAKVFRRYRPSLTMGISGRTPMASPDHLQASTLTDAAVFYSRLTKWDAEFDHLPVHTVKKHIWFPLGLGAATDAEGQPRIVSDISETIDIKLRSIQAYKTQFPPAKERVFRMVEGANMMLGATAGFAAGELFILPTPLGTPDLFASVVGGQDRMVAEKN